MENLNNVLSNDNIKNISSEILKVYGEFLYFDDKKITEAENYIRDNEKFFFDNSEIVNIDGSRDFRLINKDILTNEIYEKIINYSLDILPYHNNKTLSYLFSFIRGLKSNLYYREWEINKNGKFLEFVTNISKEFVTENDEKIIKNIIELENTVVYYLATKDKIYIEKCKPLINEIRRIISISLFTYENEYIPSIVLLLKLLLIIEDFPTIIAMKKDPINKIEA